MKQIEVVAAIIHEAARWLTKDQLDTVAWLPADKDVVEVIKKHTIE